MAKEVQQVTIKQSDSTRYGTVQRALLTAINNCIKLDEPVLAKELLSIKKYIDMKYYNIIEADIEWSEC